MKETHHYRDGQLSSAIKLEGLSDRYSHLDHLGTPRLITDGQKRKISNHDYYPFGKEHTNQTQERTLWGFTSNLFIMRYGHPRRRRESGDCAE